MDIEDTAAGTLPLHTSGTLPLDSTDKRDEGADGDKRDRIDESVDDKIDTDDIDDTLDAERIDHTEHLNQPGEHI